MTNPTTGGFEEGRRVQEAGVTGYTAQSDDLLGELDLYEALINPHDGSGGKGKGGAGASPMMMPPMAAGGGGGMPASGMPGGGIGGVALGGAGRVGGTAAAGLAPSGGAGGIAPPGGLSGIGGGGAGGGGLKLPDGGGGGDSALGGPGSGGGIPGLGGGGTAAAGLKAPTSGLPDPRDPSYPFPRPPDPRFPDPQDPNKFPVPGEPGYPDPSDPNPHRFSTAYLSAPGGDGSGHPSSPGSGGLSTGGLGGAAGWNQNPVIQASPEMLHRESQLWGDTALEMKQSIQQRADSEDTSSVDFGMMRSAYQPYADLVGRLQKWAKDGGDEFTHISETLASAAGSYRDVDQANVTASTTIHQNGV